MSFKDKIPGCFGVMDKVFAGHPLDRGRAREMLIQALRETESWGDIENAIRDYLTNEDCPTAHIDNQIQRVQDLKVYLED